jgi:2-C-methyl-D-erythritol 4-phosphate cytidylyltransferase
MSNEISIWAVVPAAGIGKRMQSDVPKQYLKVAGRAVIEHTLDRLLSVPPVQGVIVALQNDDPYWPSINIQSSKPVITTSGGSERCHSVLNALETLSDQHSSSTIKIWALVHDAVRPAVRVDDIEKLISTVSGSDAGGLLAMPVRDTMKRSGADQTVYETVDREGLWHALTPQLFDSRILKRALEQSLQDNFLVTDESSAMEHAGYRPRLVSGSEDNIKITCPGDLQLAELYLQASKTGTP